MASAVSSTQQAKSAPYCTRPGCLKENATLLCNRCKLAFYCSQECHSAYWKDHQVICNGMQAGAYLRDAKKPFASNEDLRDQLQPYLAKQDTDPQGAFDLGQKLLEKLMLYQKISENEITMQKGLIAAQKAILSAGVAVIRRVVDETKLPKLSTMIQRLEKLEKGLVVFNDSLVSLQMRQELLRRKIEEDKLKKYAAQAKKPDTPLPKKPEPKVEAKEVVAPPQPDPLQLEFEQLTREYDNWNDTLAISRKRGLEIPELEKRVNLLSTRLNEIRALMRAPSIQ